MSKDLKDKSLWYKPVPSGVRTYAITIECIETKQKYQVTYVSNVTDIAKDPPKLIEALRGKADKILEFFQSVLR